MSIKFNFDKTKHSFTISRTSTKTSTFTSTSTSNDFFQDFFKDQGAFTNPKKKKEENWFQKAKKKVDESKIGGLVYLALCLLIMNSVSPLFKVCSYPSTVAPESYSIVHVGFEKKIPTSWDDNFGNGNYYRIITVEYELDGETITGEVTVEGALADKMYDLYFNALYFDDVSALEKANRLLGTLRYHKNNPKELVRNTFYS